MFKIKNSEGLYANSGAGEGFSVHGAIFNTLGHLKMHVRHNLKYYKGQKLVIEKFKLVKDGELSLDEILKVEIENEKEKLINSIKTCKDPYYQEQYKAQLRNLQ